MAGAGAGREGGKPILLRDVIEEKFDLPAVKEQVREMQQVEPRNTRNTRKLETEMEVVVLCGK